MTEKEVISEEEEEEDEVSSLKENPHYSESAQLRMINLVYDPLSTLTLLKATGIHPDDAHLLSLSKVNSSVEAMAWANQILRESIYREEIQGYPGSWSPSQIWRNAFLLARRSLPGPCGTGFMMGVGLAREQQIAKVDEEGGGDEW